MDPRLLELLVCPICKGPLHWDREAMELVCPADRLAYPVRDGIPVMLEHEARALDAPPASPPATAVPPDADVPAPPGADAAA